MEIKDRIVDKAGELFFQYGIKNISMDELASSLGMSKRTIYEIFKDKEDILRSLILKLGDERNRIFEEFLEEGLNVVEVFINVIEIQRKMPVSNAKFLQDIYKYYPKIVKLMQENIEKNNVFLREFLLTGIGQGYIRDDLNVEVTAFLVEQSTYTYIRASYLEKPPFSFSDLFYTMMINFVRGISTEKGIKIIDAHIMSKKNLN
ncbi:MAG: TetR/AcrR family transcriptional regulator [Fermentimonas sp.]|nr:TetR/AcrR family transcriptional regulator [Fermentimonas sp.]